MTNKKDKSSVLSHMPNTPDIQQERLLQLKQLFPDLFDGEGNINAEELKLIAGDPSTSNERYDFNWSGKHGSKKAAYRPTTATLTYDEERSLNPEKAKGNVIIEGENLESLKCLLASYRGGIKCIYIDPPYNTGKDFVYSDNYSENRTAYWEETGGTDLGVKIDTNPDSSGRFHSNWMSMMYPRLLLARQLLKDDGLIFVSIDDNEVSNLRKIMDSVFGEENFIDCIIWKKRYGGGAKEKYLVTVHEYVLMYAKDISNIESIHIPLTEESIKRYYKLKDDNYEKRGPYRTHPLEATKSMGDRKNLIFPIAAPDGTNVMPKRQWLWAKSTVDDALTRNELEFIKGKNNEWSVHTKQYLKHENGEMRTGKAFSLIDDVYC